MNKFFTKFFLASTILFGKNFSVQHILNLEKPLPKITSYLSVAMPIISAGIDKFLNKKFVSDNHMQYYCTAIESFSLSLLFLELYPDKNSNIIETIIHKDYDATLVSLTILSAITLKSIMLKYVFENDIENIDTFEESFTTLLDDELEPNDVKAFGNIASTLLDD